MIIEAALSNRWPWAAWWGYAEADSTLVGVLVVAIVLLAVIYVIRRVIRQVSGQAIRRDRGPRSRSRKHSGSRG